MQEMWLWFLGQEDSLEEGMATHSSILAWRITLTEEPVGLQSIELCRVRFGWSNWGHMHSCSYSLFLLLHRITVTFGAAMWLTKRFPFPASLEARFACVYGIVNVSPSVVENIKMCKKSWDDEERNTFWEKHLSFFWLLSFFRPWVSQSRSVMSDSLWSHALYTPWNSLGQNTGVGSLSLLQGIFPAQELNPGLPNCRQVLYQLSHQGMIL